MGRYADWAGYNAMFPDGLDEAEFLAVVGRAEAFVDVVTAGRARDAQGDMLERVKMAVCALAEEIAAQRAACNTDGVQIEEVSNDGYREKYHIPDAPAKTGTDMNALEHIAKRYLSGTGLVSAL